MTQAAIALYLGESYATLSVFDLASSASSSSTSSSALYEKSVYLPQTSLRSLITQAKAACSESEIKEIYIVTRYMDRLKNFRLGGSVVQVVPEGFENSYSLTNTQLQSLAAPALILPVKKEADEKSLAADLARLKKINSEINKVVFQLPEDLFTAAESDLIKNFFIKEGFKSFSMANPYDFESVRRTLLNAGSEGTKEEIVSDLKELLGEDSTVMFWVQDRFTSDFENIDLYFSSHYFLKNYLTQQNKKKLFYFDLENWNLVTTDIEDRWQSPWGAMNYPHPHIEELAMSPYCELVVNTIGQMEISKNTPQFEPGPIVAGRSVKALVFDAFSDEFKKNKLVTSLFPLLATDAIQQKVNNQFQILLKAQTMDTLRLTRDDVKNWLHSLVSSWMIEKSDSSTSDVIGDLAPFFYKELGNNSAFKLSHFSWTEQIQKAALIQRPPEVISAKVTEDAAEEKPTKKTATVKKTTKSTSTTAKASSSPAAASTKAKTTRTVKKGT